MLIRLPQLRLWASYNCLGPSPSPTYLPPQFHIFSWVWIEKKNKNKEIFFFRYVTIFFKANYTFSSYFFTAITMSSLIFWSTWLTFPSILKHCFNVLHAINVGTDICLHEILDHTQDYITRIQNFKNTIYCIQTIHCNCLQSLITPIKISWEI